MSRAFADIAFTPSVRAAQKRYGSRASNEGFELAPDRQDQISEFEREFIEARDGFYQATVSETGWPYVQFRGGPIAFLKVLDSKRLGYADFRGNVQYLSVGNINATGRIVLFLMDYAARRRLKIWGKARIVHRADEPALVAALVDPTYRARVERGIVIDVEAFDWNCPQHITPRFTEAEVRKNIAPLLDELQALRLQSNGQRDNQLITGLGSGDLRLVVSGVRILTSSVRSYELRAADDGPLPQVEPGAHIAVPVQTKAGADETRHYSIASDPDDPTRWEIAVLREPNGRGGSAFIHDHYAPGTPLKLVAPKNGFCLHSDQRPAVLIAGGIGIAPLKSMAHALKRDGRQFTVHFAARSSREAPYLAELQREFGANLQTYWSELGTGARADIEALLTNSPAEAVFYVCGPQRMLDAAREVADRLQLRDDRIRFERFAAPMAEAGDRPFEVKLRRTGVVLQVPIGRSILDVLLASGELPTYDCKTGTCGTCAVKVLEGQPDHRDMALSRADRDESGLMCTCVSRSLGDRLTLDM